MTMAHTQPTPDQARSAWDRIAPGFDRFTTPLSISMGEAALRRVGLRSGMGFLDVAAGSGALSIPAARCRRQSPDSPARRPIRRRHSRWPIPPSCAAGRRRTRAVLRVRTKATHRIGLTFAWVRANRALRRVPSKTR